MILRKAVLLLALGCWMPVGLSAQPLPAVAAAPASSLDARVNALLAKMTLEEKIGQMTQYHQWKKLDEKSGVDISAGKVGSFLNVFGAKSTNETQRVAVEKSRLHIPLIFGLD